MFLTKILTVILLLTITLESSARDTRTATSSGIWKTAGNWSPASIPAYNQTNNTDDIVIDITGGTPGSITLNDDFTLKSGTTLTIRACDTLIITGNATFSNGSSIQVDSCAVLIILGNLDNKNNSNDINIDGGLTVGGNYTGGQGSVISGSGVVDVDGSINLSGGGSPGIISTSILPIELLHFNATFNENRVDFAWSTASEINNEFFIIERSKDGYEWQDAVEVSGAGNSTTIRDYFEFDDAPFTGVSYYRLKQIDYDGKETIFNVVPVENIEGGRVAFNIFPNPTSQGNINLSFKGFENEIVLVVVRDIQGKEHYSKVTVVERNDEIQILAIDNDLPKGIYLVTASSVNSLYSQKVIIK